MQIVTVDPKGLKEGEQTFKKVEWFDSAYSADGADLIVILTEWNEI